MKILNDIYYFVTKQLLYHSNSRYKEMAGIPTLFRSERFLESSCGGMAIYTTCREPHDNPFTLHIIPGVHELVPCGARAWIARSNRYAAVHHTMDGARNTSHGMMYYSTL